MGDKRNGPFQLSFNASLKVDFQGSRVTSDAGLVLARKFARIVSSCWNATARTCGSS